MRKFQFLIIISAIPLFFFLKGFLKSRLELSQKLNPSNDNVSFPDLKNNVIKKQNSSTGKIEPYRESKKNSNISQIKNVLEQLQDDHRLCTEALEEIEILDIDSLDINKSFARYLQIMERGFIYSSYHNLKKYWFEKNKASKEHWMDLVTDRDHCDIFGQLEILEKFSKKNLNRKNQKLLANLAYKSAMSSTTFISLAVNLTVLEKLSLKPAIYPKNMTFKIKKIRKDLNLAQKAIQEKFNFKKINTENPNYIVEYNYNFLSYELKNLFELQDKLRKLEL